MSYQLHTGCSIENFLPGWSSVGFVRLLTAWWPCTVPAWCPSPRWVRRRATPPTATALGQLSIPWCCPDADSYAATLARGGSGDRRFAERKADIAASWPPRPPRVGGGCKPIEDDALLDRPPWSSGPTCWCASLSLNFWPCRRNA